MQREIKLGGRQVVAGLQWNVLQDAGSSRSRLLRERRQAKELGKKAALPYAIFYETQSAAAIGLGSRASTSPSAAILLAESNAARLKDASFADNGRSSWIVVEAVETAEGESLYWMGAILDGVPAPGSDIVDSFDAVALRITELLETVENPEVFSTDAAIQDFLSDFGQTTPMGFAELTQAAPSKGPRLKKVGGIPKPVLIAGGVVVALVALYMANGAYSDYRAKKAHEAAVARERAQAQRLAQQSEQQSDQLAREQTKKAIQNAMNSVTQALDMPPSRRIASWLATTEESLSFNFANWSLTGISCDTQQCVVSLARTAYGTNDSLMNAVPSAKINGDSATYVLDLKTIALPAPTLAQVLAGEAGPVGPGMAPIPLGGSATQAPGATPATKVMLGTREQLLRGWVSDLQAVRNVGVSYEVSSDSPITYRPVAPAPKQATSPGAAGVVALAPVPLGVAKGTFTLTGKGWWQLAGMKPLLDRPGFVVNTLKVGAVFEGNDQSWTLTGSYFVATGDGPATRGMSIGASTPIAGAAGTAALTDEEEQAAKGGGYRNAAVLNAGSNGRPSANYTSAQQSRDAQAALFAPDPQRTPAAPVMGPGLPANGGGTGASTLPQGPTIPSAPPESLRPQSQLNQTGRSAAP